MVAEIKHADLRELDMGIGLGSCWVQLGPCPCCVYAYALTSYSCAGEGGALALAGAPQGPRGRTRVQAPRALHRARFQAAHALKRSAETAHCLAHGAGKAGGHLAAAGRNTNTADESDLRGRVWGR